MATRSERAFSLWLRHRGLAALAVLAFSAVLGWFALRVRADYAIEHFFPKWSEARATYDRFKHDFPHAETEALAIVSGNDLFTAEGLARLGELEAALGKVPHVGEVIGPRSVDDIVGDDIQIEVADLFPDGLDSEGIARQKHIATTDPMFAWNLASPDGNAVSIRIALEPNAAATDLGRQEMSRAAERVLDDYRSDWTIALSGSPAIRARFVRLVQADVKTLMPIALAVVLLILLVAYRSVGAVIASLATMIASITWTVGFMGILGYHFTMISSILPIVVMIISLSDTVHIVNDFFTERREGLERNPALARAMAHAAGPCLATEVVIACGFLSLIAVNIVGIIEFGIAAAGAMLLTWLANMTVLPLMLSLTRGVPGGPRPEGSALVGRFARFVDWIGKQTMERPRRIVTVAAVILIGAGIAASQVKKLSYVFDDLRPESSFYRELRFAEAAHGGLVAVAIFVEVEGGGDNAALDPEIVRLVDRGAELLRSYPEIAQANSVADHFRKGYRIFSGAEVPEPDGVPSTRALNAQLALFIDESDMLRNYLAFDRQSAVALGYARDAGSTRVAEMFREIDAWVASEQAKLDARGGPRIKISATGQLQIFDQVNHRLLGGLVASFAGAVLATLIVFCIVLRSVSLGLIGIVPNIAPMVLTVAFMAITGITLRPSTVILFSIVLVIADDDTIQYLARLRRHYSEAKRRGEPGDLHRAASLGALRESGLPMFVTSTAVSLGFLLLTFSTLRGSADLGLLIGATLFFAIFADLFLAPILVSRLRPRLDPWYRK